jgi:hypothetical protein
LDIESGSPGEGVRHKLSANHHGFLMQILRSMSSDVEAEIRCHRILYNPGEATALVLHTMCYKRGYAQNGAFSSVSFLEHKWADSETISLGDYGTTGQAGPFSHSKRLGASKFGVGGGRQAIAFAKLLARLQHRTQNRTCSSIR